MPTLALAANRRSTGELSNVGQQDRSPVQSTLESLTAMTGIDFDAAENAAQRRKQPKVRTAQKAMKSMAKALAMANLQNTEEAWDQRGDDVQLQSGGMSSALIKSQMSALAIAQEEEDRMDPIIIPALDDLPASSALRVSLPIRDPFQVENRASQHKRRNLELCKAFAESAKPQPLVYRGVRGIDFIFEHKQNKHLESLKAAESGEALEEQVSTGGVKNRIARALDVLGKSAFFRDMEKQREGILQKLAKVAVFRRETHGQLLFREFDPPGSCYVLIEGSVGVYIKKTEPNTPRIDPKDANDYETLTDTANPKDATPRDSRAVSKASGTDAAAQDPAVDRQMSKTSTGSGPSQGQKPTTRRSMGIGRTKIQSSQKLSPLPFSASALADDVKKRKDKKRDVAAWDIRKEYQSKDENGRPVWLTTDGFSIFAEDSELGTKVVTLEPGAIIGEVALLNDAPRKASIKCLEKCEFLIIRSKSFRKVLADFMDVGRIMNVLSGVKMFKSMETANPGIISGLAHHAQFTKETKDQVIFREGDPGQNCFVVVTGQVGVYIRKKDKRYPLTPRQPGDTPSLSDWRRSGREQRDKDERERLERQGIQPKGPQVFRTNEGFSYFSEESSFGDRVALLPGGTIFGELALQNDAPRAATIKCEKDSEILVLRKQDYLDCVEGMLGKVRFFERNVMGVAKVVDATGKLDTHPSAFFKEEMVQPGHALLFEGLIAKPTIFVVGDGGTVDFMRFKRPESNPAYVLADRPQSAPTNDFQELAFGKLKPIQLHRTASDGILRSSIARFPPANLPEDDEGTEFFDRLEAGGIFCSMAALPSPGVEPFTVVVSSPGPCKMFMCSGSKIDKLPLKLLNIIRKHMANASRQRLDKVKTPWTKFGHARRASDDSSEESELAITPIHSPRNLDEEVENNKHRHERVRVQDERTIAGGARFGDRRRRAFANFA